MKYDIITWGDSWGTPSWYTKLSESQKPNYDKYYHANYILRDQYSFTLLITSSFLIAECKLRSKSSLAFEEIFVLPISAKKIIFFFIKNFSILVVKRISYR